jgi:lipid-binding SYLF domain-containing protein
MRDPQRVCVQCHDILDKAQEVLAGTIANHQRLNPIDVDLHTCSVRRYTNMPYSYTLGSELRKAAYSTYNLFNSNWVHDETLVIRLMAKAKGLAFLTVAKIGLVFAPLIGTGLVIARMTDGSWSAPSAIGTFGLSWGALAGAEVTDYVVLLNTSEAVAAFAGEGQLSIGVGIDVAVGPIGR